MPKYPPRQTSLGEDFRAAYTHHRAGRLDRAEALYRKVLRRVPAHADSLNLLGVIALDRGRPEHAVELIGRAILISPKFAEAYSNLGNALLAAGRLAEAIENYRQALTINPRFAPAHSNLARALNATSAFAAALESCRTAVALDSSLPEPHYNMAIALHGLSRQAEAEAMCRAALKIRPGVVDWRREYAVILGELGRPDEALTIVDALLSERPDDAASHFARATILYRISDISGSEVAYRRATTLMPRDPHAWNGLGRAERAQGHFAAAEASFRRALALAPKHADAHRNLALIGAIRADQAEAHRLTGLLDGPELVDQDRVAVGFALGKLLDDADRFDEAFARYRTANALFRAIQAAAGKHFDLAVLTADIDRTIVACSSTNLAKLAEGGVTSDLPVFIVGMPRSGTSLVEQIAASHNSVFGAGELRDIGRISAEVLGAKGAANAWEGWDAEAARRLATAHVTKLARLGNGAARVIDKLPDNIFMLGRIAALFPGARVVFCRRDPRDTCLSCYFSLFAAGNLFSYDLIDCAHRCLETDRLMAHWQKVLPLPTLTIDYEKLVGHLESEARRLVDFLELDWDPACLDFHQTERTVVTASSWQVRQPLYQRSVGRWRNYERHLGPLLDLFAVASGSKQSWRSRG
jgi:tetratricopeptide (TPR) repeat protein